nr:WD repeat containing protein 65 [Hymenolepis microstoma]
MAISPNRRYLALAEKKKECPCISIYDLASLNRVKILRGTGLNTDEFKSIAFSPDSTYLIAQGGEPGWVLTYYEWEKAKRIASVKTSQFKRIHEVSINPYDSTLICVTGKETFRLYKYTDEFIKPVGHSRVDRHNIRCHAWISDDRIAIGTVEGKLLLIKNGEVLEEHTVVPPVPITYEESSSSSISSDSVLEGVTAIAAASNFIFVACAQGSVHCYKYNPNADQLRRRRRRSIATSDDMKNQLSYYNCVKQIRIPTDRKLNDGSDDSSKWIIAQLCINPSEEILIAGTESHQLYYYDLSAEYEAQETMAENENFEQIMDDRPVEKPKESESQSDPALKIDYFRQLAQSFHEGQIVGLDICTRKPLIATCATDNTVRIWNFETNDLDLYKEFPEEAYSIALHPLGHFILVGFSDKLRLLNLLIDDIRSYKEFPIRGCQECAFSNGGHLFAAVQGNNILLYSAISFKLLNTLKAHNGKIRCLLWSSDDSKLISCGMDGAIYEWDPYTGRRISENVMKSCSYTSVTASEDGKMIYAVGSDRKLKEVTDSTIVQSVNSADMLLTTVALSRNGKMLVCGSQDGHVRSYKYPFTEKNVWDDYVGHSGQIVKMKITLNDEYLVTVSSDSTVMIWSLQERHARNVKIERETAWAEEVLVMRSDLAEKDFAMQELRARVDEQKMENEYQLRLKDMNFSDRIRELSDKFLLEMESLRQRNQLLQADKDREESRYSDEKQEIMRLHVQEVKSLEAAKTQQLALEREKYSEFQKETKRMQKAYQIKIDELTTLKEQAIMDLKLFFEAKLDRKMEEIGDLKRENREQVTEFEFTKRLLEEDGDKEILGLKTDYEQKLRKERELVARHQGEAGIAKKKCESLQKEIDEHLEELKKSQRETQKLNGVIKSLERDLSGLKKEIQERDETIQEKEKRIYDLKKKNEELEKYKFVLSYKITELKKLIEPRESDIRKYKEQIQEMEGELERFNQQNSALELTIEELKEKLKATLDELKSERNMRRNIYVTVKRFRTDIYNVVGKIQEPKALKEGILELYRKHIQNDMLPLNSVESSEVMLAEEMQREFSRQRDHLERTLAGVRKKLAKDTALHKSEFIRVMHENMGLIEEVNKLRVELRNARHRVHNLESTMGINRKQGNKAQEILERIIGARPNPVIVADLEQANRTLHEQSNFIYGLQQRIIHGPQYCDDNNNNLGKVTLPPLQPGIEDDNSYVDQRAASEKLSQSKFETLSPKADSVE